MSIEQPTLVVEDLSVEILGHGHPVTGVSFEVGRGEMVGIVGESGSGKSMTLRSMSGLLPFGVRAQVAGSVTVAGTEVIGASGEPRRHQRVGGRAAFGYVFQEPLAALNPGFTIRRHLLEAMRPHGMLGSRGDRHERLVAALDEVRLPDPERVLRSHPHELSGGMRQRVVIALALLGRPHVLLADEPTTALDVTVAAEVLDLVQALQKSHALATVLVSHDLSLVAERCDRVIVMRAGEIVESASAQDIMRSPQHPYTQALLAATVDPFDPTLSRTQPDGEASTVLLSAEHLSVSYSRRRRGTEPVNAVDDVDVRVAAGEVLGVVGESGSGKSSLAKALAGMQSTSAGAVRLGERVVTTTHRDRSWLTGDVQMVFQDPYSSLNPRMTVQTAIQRALAIHQPALDRLGRTRAVHDLLDDVGLPQTFESRFPHELSGGQRQRVVVARALAAAPRVLLADEPTSALDVSVQAQILDLLRALVDERGLGMLLITHDFAAVRAIADRVIVMHKGRIVEAADVDALITSPQHPYTRRLLESVPSASRAGRLEDQEAS